MKGKIFDCGTAVMTSGPIGRQLVCFALPLLAGSLVQQLYNAVDLMFVGRFIGKEAAAAVGSSGMMVTCIVGFFTGLSAGVGVVAGKAAGAGDAPRLRRIIQTAAGLTLAASILLTAAGLAAAPSILRLMNTPPELMDGAMAYIRLYLLSLPSIVSFNVGAGILRALGDSRSPTLYQILGGLTNVAGNFIFICLLGWGVRGAALTTICAQSMAAALTVRHLCRMDGGFRLRISEVRIERALCAAILGVGIPAAVQAIVISLSNLIVQSNINELGVDVMAAFTAYYKVETLIYFPIIALGQACSAFTSQNTGAGRIERVKSGGVSAVLIGLAVTAVTSALCIVCAGRLFALFTSDAAVVALGRSMAFVAFPFYFLYVFLEMLSSLIRGAGSAVAAMIIVTVNMCAVRVAALEAVMLFSPDAASVAAIYPFTWGCTVLCLFVYYKSGRWIPKYGSAKF